MIDAQLPFFSESDNVEDVYFLNRVLLANMVLKHDATEEEKEKFLIRNPQPGSRTSDSINSRFCKKQLFKCVKEDGDGGGNSDDDDDDDDNGGLDVYFAPKPSAVDPDLTLSGDDADNVNAPTCAAGFTIDE